jgi:TolB-like protein
MNANEWERIKSLFDAAVSIPEEQRLQWIRETCAEYPELCETLLQLLQNYDEPDPREIEPKPLFQPGEIVAGRFCILRFIKRGGMGEVYEARDQNLHGIRVALKTLRLGLASERQALDRFKREVWVAREISHEGICRIYDLVEHRALKDDRTETLIPCLTMKLLDGESLTDFLSRRRPLAPAEALPLIRQIAVSLQAMHQKQIVHRDLKPSNVMLVPNPEDGSRRVILVDFGLAKPLNREEVWNTKTEQSQAVSPFFAAPEVLKRQKCGIAADIYALGLVIDEMVTSRPAFPHESVEELFWHKLNRDPERPSHRSVHLPKHWDGVILWCLSRDPRLRPQSAAEVVDALENPALFRMRRLLSKALDHYSPFGARKRAYALPIPRRVVLAGMGGAVLAFGAAEILGKNPPPLKSSLLIYPFENLTKKLEYEHLCTGTVEELARRLSYMGGLDVFPIRKFWKADPEAIKSARFSLKGQLENSNGKPSLSVQLVENATGRFIWNQTFDDLLRQPLKLENEIADKTIAGICQRAAWATGMLPGLEWALHYHLPYERQSSTELPSSPTRSNTAFEEYQKGRELLGRRTKEAALEATECFKRAIDIDDKFALAFAALADVQPVLLTYNYRPTEELLNEALKYADQAVSLDRTLPECHAARGGAKQNFWDWAAAEQSYQTAIRTQPKFARARDWYAGLLIQFEQFDAGLSQAHQSMKLDPFDYPGQTNYGFYLWMSGRLKEAVKHLDEVLRKADLFYSHNVLGQVCAGLVAASPEPEATFYFTKSITQAGLVQGRELESAGGTDPGYLKWSDLIYAQAYAERGDKRSAQQYVNRLERGFQAGKISASAVAWAHAAMDNRKDALELLKYGLEHHEREMLYVRVSPRFRVLRDEPGFKDILQRMKLV